MYLFLFEVAAKYHLKNNFMTNNIIAKQLSYDFTESIPYAIAEYNLALLLTLLVFSIFKSQLTTTNLKWAVVTGIPVYFIFQQFYHDIAGYLTFLPDQEQFTLATMIFISMAILITQITIKKYRSPSRWFALATTIVTLGAFSLIHLAAIEVYFKKDFKNIETELKHIVTSSLAANETFTFLNYCELNNYYCLVTKPTESDNEMLMTLTDGNAKPILNHLQTPFHTISTFYKKQEVEDATYILVSHSNESSIRLALDTKKLATATNLAGSTVSHWFSIVSSFWIILAISTYLAHINRWVKKD
jgi:hypothetical protein